MAYGHPFRAGIAQSDESRLSSRTPSLMTRSASRLLSALGSDLDSFWVCGLALLQVCLVSLWLDPKVKSFDWAQYLLLGTVFPAIVLGVSLAGRVGPRGSALLRWLRLGLAAFGVWACSAFVYRHWSGTVLLAAMGQWAIFKCALAWRERRWGGGPTGASGRACARGVGSLADRTTGLPCFAVLLIAWAVTFQGLKSIHLGDAIVGSTYTLLVFEASLLLVTLHLVQPLAGMSQGRPAWRRVGNGAAILLIALASARMDSLPDPFAVHHWSVFVGPAALVRQGGWLLWDVPCQYGFLSTLTVAWLPVASVWQSFYLVHVALVTLSLVFLFLVLRSLRAGVANLVFSLAVTLAALFVTGNSELLSGPSWTPSLGAVRYFWCYALLGVLAWEFHADLRGRLPRATMLIGCATWLVGTFWSAESAVYCAATWLPAYALMVLRRAVTRHPGPGRTGGRIRTALPWLALPPLLLLTTLGAITTYYVLALGHRPEWAAYLEYSLSFAKGMNSAPIDPGGSVWVSLLVLCALSTVVASALRRGRSLGSLVLTTGVWGAFWSTNSYFVQRGGIFAITVYLAPMLCLAVGLVAHVLARTSMAPRTSALLRAGLAPVLVALLTLGFGNAGRTPDWYGAIRSGYVRKIERRLPVMDDSLRELLLSARVNDGDPIVYIDDSIYLNPVPRRRPESRWRGRTWLPTQPLALHLPLPADRSQAYMARFTARTGAGGWLIQPRALPAGRDLSWFFEGVVRTHERTRTFENASWVLSWYEPKRPEYRSR
jgi:hypothetical protein